MCRVCGLLQAVYGWCVNVSLCISVLVVCYRGVSFLFENLGGFSDGDADAEL